MSDSDTQVLFKKVQEQSFHTRTVFTAAGLKKPDISILSDQFLAEVRGLKHKNVAAELLAKLLKDEITTHTPRNLVQSRQFSEMLQKALNQYHNRAIATQKVIEELIALAKKMSNATQRGTDLGLTDEDIAFYDALAANESAKIAMGDAKLRLIAAELVTQVRKSVTIDWTLRDGAQAKIRVMVKRILNKYGYPPDMQDAAVQEVLSAGEGIVRGLGDRVVTVRSPKKIPQFERGDFMATWMGLPTTHLNSGFG